VETFHTTTTLHVSHDDDIYASDNRRRGDVSYAFHEP